MRKLKLQMHITLDGYVASPDGGNDWMVRSPDGLQKVNELIDTSDTLLLGRKMTAMFVNYWEGVQPGSPEYTFAQKMVAVPKIVFSKTVTTAPGKNVSVENGDLAEEVNKLKQQDGKDILVYGGAGFVSSLIKEDLIDELNLFVNPVLINKGMRIFDLLDHRQKFSLLSATPFSSGTVVLTYALTKK